MKEWTAEQFAAVRQALTAYSVGITLGRWQSMEEIVEALEEDIQVCNEEIAVLDARSLINPNDGVSTA